MSHVFSLLSASCILTVADAAAAPEQAAQLSREVREQNSLIENNLPVPLRGCRNNFARIREIKGIISSISPQLNKLMGERTNLEAALSRGIADLRASQKKFAEAEAAIRGLQRQIDEGSRSTRDQVASIDQRITKFSGEKLAAIVILEDKNNEYQAFRDANQDQLDDIFLLQLQENPPPLKAAQQSLVNAYQRFNDEIDILEEQIQRYTSIIERFQMDRQAVLDRKTIARSELPKMIGEKINERQAARANSNELRRHRDKLVKELGAKTAVIASISQLRIPDNHPVCSKVLNN